MSEQPTTACAFDQAIADALRAWKPGPIGDARAQREELVKLLGLVATLVGSFADTPCGEFDTEGDYPEKVTVIEESYATRALRQLATAINDLNNGICVKFLKVVKTDGTNMKDVEERDRRNLMIQTDSILKESRKEHGIVMTAKQRADLLAPFLKMKPQAIIDGIKNWRNGKSQNLG